MKKDTIIIVTDPELMDHDTGGGDHPEVADRLQVIDERLRGGVLADHVRFLRPRPVEREWLLTYHTESWLLRFEEEVLSGRSYIGHPDNQVCYDTYRVALLSAGGGIAGVDLVEKGQKGVVFCSVRPPGHHAEPGMPYGFCYLNNCVVAARYWQKTYSRSRICILDFDAHHGNGIQSAFENEADTLYISIHEHPSFSYPGTGLEEDDGSGPGAGTICNIPLLPGATDHHFLQQLDTKVADKLTEFRPDAMIVAAGFDGHQQDDMSDLHYTTGLFGQLGEWIGVKVNEYCEGRLVSILEGGYDLSSLGESVEAYLAGLQSGMQHKK